MFSIYIALLCFFYENNIYHSEIRVKLDFVFSICVLQSHFHFIIIFQELVFHDPNKNYHRQVQHIISKTSSAMSDYETNLSQKPVSQKLP